LRREWRIRGHPQPPATRAPWWWRGGGGTQPTVDFILVDEGEELVDDLVDAESAVTVTASLCIKRPQSVGEPSEQKIPVISETVMVGVGGRVSVQVM
jgi:hypothetical protein